MSSPNTLSQTFYGLGPDNLWKQLIDGQYHDLGPDVFDKGKHGRHIEPGFLRGVTEGAAYAVEALSSSDISVEIYKEIHKKACSHFNGTRESGTGASDSGGKFRYNVYVQETYEAHLWGANKEEKEIMRNCSYVYQLGAHIMKDPDDLENLSAAYNKWSRPKWEALDSNRDQVVSIMARTFKTAAALNIASKGHGINFQSHPDAIVVRFEAVKDLEETVPSLFKEFNEKISATSNRDEKLKLIAQLYQTLEWKHPPSDGTTRTDYILLNALLCKYGFNPAILDDPAYATLHTLEDWIQNLEKGMEAWRVEKAKCDQ